MYKLVSCLKMFHTLCKLYVNSTSYITVLCDVFYYKILLVFSVRKRISFNLKLFLKTGQFNGGKPIYISVVGFSHRVPNFYSKEPHWLFWTGSLAEILKLTIPTIIRCCAIFWYSYYKRQICYRSARNQTVFCITRSKMCFLLLDPKCFKKIIHQIFVKRTAYFHPQQILYSAQYLMYKRYRNIKIQILNSHLIWKSILPIKYDATAGLCSRLLLREDRNRETMKQQVVWRKLQWLEFGLHTKWVCTDAYDTADTDRYSHVLNIDRPA